MVRKGITDSAKDIDNPISIRDNGPNSNIGNSNDSSTLKFYVPSDIPPEVLVYGSELRQLGVGRHTMIYSEMVVPGRIAHGESFEYDICYMKALGLNQENQLKFTDIAILEPSRQNLNQLGILAPYSVVGSIYLLCPHRFVKSLSDKINSSLSNNNDVLAGASVLPYESGIIVRILGEGANDMRSAIFGVVRITRRSILNAPFSGIRKS
ncbi:MAG: urease accessory protein UreD [Nitrososphaeraceae archaeon]